MSTLWRDLIDIPERAGADDYVLKLTDGVSQDHVAATVADYVVTEPLVGAFDQALDLVAAALRDGQSRAAFLAGSFGSGKSHFMAVLYALLGHVPAARAKTELAPVIARHDAAINNKKILRLAYHFLGATSMEEVLLGGYVNQIRALHPDCALPAVHNSDALLEDADRLRTNLGDEKFFAGLARSSGSTAGSTDPWGAVLGTGWDASSYAAARSAPSGNADRNRLVGDLVAIHFQSFTRSGDYVSLEEGLVVIAAHAKSLGYDAIVLFLDELVLWLAFQVRNHEFFARESQKITKLVEAGGASRVIPLVAFVARQMDLRRYFVEAGGAGSELEALDSAFRHQEGRFATITLGDDNLPYVAEKRLLKPRDDAARAQIDFAFQGLDRRPQVWDVLLDGIHASGTHRGSDQDAFRRTYPFSPALVSTLRTLASAMQRDRTALKVMQKVLVRGRNTLTVDDVIPVGDVFDDVVDGQNAVTQEMGARIANARKLYLDKLRPVLLRDHSLADEDVAGLPHGHPFFADEGLAKTLVLSAVAPEVAALKDLTPSRLAALNHGSIVSPVPGQEASAALAKIKRWAVDVPEIHISDGALNPTIRMQISEVEYESVIRKARGEDNPGRRRETLKKLVWSAFGLEDGPPDAFGVQRQNRIWRGSKREIEVVFGNVRRTDWPSDKQFEAGPDTWRFVVDYPFDEDGRGPVDDVRRIEALKASGLSTRTIAWLPHFLTRQLQDDLGELVVLDWLLSPGDRYQQHANHLAEADRAQARALLENRQRALHERLARAVQECYGAAARTPGMVDVDPEHQHVLLSLDAGFDPQEPVGTDLAVAFTNLIDQAFTSTFPMHPDFQPPDKEIRAVEIAGALDAIEQAHQDPSGRVPIEAGKRETLRRVLNPLKLGMMGETHLVFAADQVDWVRRFSIAMGRDGLDPQDVVTVERLRTWIGAQEPSFGLRPEIADLVIRAWAVLENRAWYRHGTLIPTPTPGAMAADVELRPEALPGSADWSRAVTRAGALFGFAGNAYLTGAAVAELVDRVAKDASEVSGSASALVDHLNQAATAIGVPHSSAGRIQTAVAARDLVAASRGTGDKVAFVERLAQATLPASDQAVARSLKTASDVAASIARFQWDRLAPLLRAEQAADERGRAAKLILDRLRASFGHDELAESLPDALRRAEDDAWKFTSAPATQPTPTTSQPPESAPEPGASGRRAVRSAADLQAALEELKVFATEHEGSTVTVEWRTE